MSYGHKDLININEDSHLLNEHKYAIINKEMKENVNDENCKGNKEIIII